MLLRPAAPLALLALVPAALAQNPTPAPGFPTVHTGNAVSSPALIQIDDDPELEILQVFGGAGIGSEVVILNHDGTPVPGWPANIATGTFGAPCFGDIDGDGEGEVVVTDFFFGLSGSLYAFEADGTLKSGFPVSFGGPFKPPALGDLDGDGDLEIVCIFNTGGASDVYAIDGNGLVLPGWPRSLDSTGGGSPTIGDVDGDGLPEIFAPAFETVYGFNIAGQDLPGFPIDLGNQSFSYSNISLADLDQDGDRELVFGTQNENFVDLPGRVWALQHDGTPVAGWPRETSSSVYAPPAVADIDNDGSLEVIVGNQLLSPTPVSSLYGWEADGTPVAGFPIGGQDAFHQQVTIADVDGDGRVELLYETNVAGQSYKAFNDDGTPLVGWTLPAGPLTQAFNQQLAVGDVDLDGNLDLVGSLERFQAGQSEFYIWETGTLWIPELAPIPTTMGSNTRDGHVNGEVSPTVALYGCGQNPPGSLFSNGDLPLLGQTLGFAVDNPLGTQPAGSIASLVFSIGGIAEPCGLLVPGFGMAGGGAAGELLLAPNFFFAGTAPYQGAGSPTQFDLPVPFNPNLVGESLFFQGVVADFSGGIGLSTGFEVRVGL